MTFPTYGDVTQIVDLASVMDRTRDRMASAASFRDLEIATKDFAALRAEKSRREAGGAVFVPASPTFTLDDVVLVDDGTLDTVLRVHGVVFRFGDSADFRDPETGALDLAGFVETHADYIAEGLAS